MRDNEFSHTETTQFLLDLAMIAKRRQRQPRVGDEVIIVIGLQISDSDCRQIPAGRRAGVVVPDRQSTDTAQRTVARYDEHIVWTALERSRTAEMTHATRCAVVAH